MFKNPINERYVQAAGKAVATYTIGGITREVTKGAFKMAETSAKNKTKLAVQELKGQQALELEEKKQAGKIDLELLKQQKPSKPTKSAKISTNPLE